jgi:short-subunit dehydrogenase involved in D-alanine esterification of teichoic acids
MDVGAIAMKTSGNTIPIPSGKSGGGRGFAQAFQAIGLPATLYIVWGDIR